MKKLKKLPLEYQKERLSRVLALLGKYRILKSIRIMSLGRVGLETISPDKA